MEVSGRRAGGPLSDQIDAGSVEGESDVTCQPCGSEGDRVTAIAYCENCMEYFCEACVKFHRKQAISNNHSILERDQMPKHIFHESDACTDLCTKHQNEAVRFYCQTHDLVGCGDCRVLDHRECNVSLIKALSDAYIKGCELGEIHEKINQLREEVITIKQDIYTNGQSLNANHDQVLDDIKAFRKEINKNLDKMEAEVKSLAIKLKGEKESTLSDAHKCCTALETEISDMEIDLKVQSSNNGHFVKAKRAKKRLSEVDVEIKSLEVQSKVLYHKFEGDWGLKEQMQSGKLLGEIVTLPLKPVGKQEPKYIEKVNLNQPNDAVCYITDSILIETGKVLLVDRNNTCIKLVDVQKNEIMSVFKICNRPFGLAAISSDLVVVTIPAAQKIQFLTYKTELTERYSLEVNGECLGIDCRNNRIALTYAKPSKAEILTLTGTVLYTIKVSGIQIPSYIVFGQDAKTVFVSKYHRGKVRKYDFNGKILSTYHDKNLLNPAGLIMTRDGTLLICNAGERQCVHIVTSSNCKKIKDMLTHDVDNIESPRCISYCEETSRLYLCNGTGSLEKNCNTLKVYQC